MTQMPTWYDATMHEKGRLLPISISLEQSTSAPPRGTLVIASGADIPGVHDFILIYDTHGDPILMRVVSVAYGYRGTMSIQMIGAVDTLSDDLYKQTATEDQTKAAGVWIALILDQQTTTRWRLGTCALNASVKIRPNYQDLWSLMELVRQARPGYMWQYDYTTSPWTISLIEMPSTVACEFRVTRNLESAQVSISDQDLCNKLVFTVSGNDGTSSVTEYDNLPSQAKYGIRARCTDIKADDIPPGMSAADYAAQELAKNAEPVITIQISGADLHDITGDAFDQIALGSMCRAVLPEYGDPIVERVVAYSWPDLVSEPEHVKVTLSTEPASFTGSIASAKQMAKAVKVARGGGGGGKADKDLQWSKVLTDTIESVDGTGIKELWQSGIQMTSHGGVRIFSLYQGMASLDSEVKINNDAITAEVSRATAAEGTLSGQIQVQAGKVALVVEETSGGNVIKAASITAAINDAGSSAVIKADHIELVGSSIKLGTVITADSGGAVVRASTVTATVMGASTGEFDTVRTLSGGAYVNLAMRTTTVVTDAATGATTTIRYLGLAPISGGGT